MMSTMQQKAMIAGFTAAERDYIRGNLDQVFSTLPTVADGFLLKTWRSGPQAGQPKVPLPAKGLIERGLMRIDAAQRLVPAIVHRNRPGGVADDDDGSPPRRPGEVCPNSSGTRHPVTVPRPGLAIDENICRTTCHG